MKKFKKLMETANWATVFIFLTEAPLLSMVCMHKVPVEWVYCLLLWAATLNIKFVKAIAPKTWHQMIGYTVSLLLIILCSLTLNPILPFLAELLFSLTILIDCFVCPKEL